MTGQEYSTGLGIKLVCHLEDDREPSEPPGACESGNWLALRDQDSYAWQGHTHPTAGRDALNIRKVGFFSSPSNIAVIKYWPGGHLQRQDSLLFNIIPPPLSPLPPHLSLLPSFLLFFLLLSFSLLLHISQFSSVTLGKKPMQFPCHCMSLCMHGPAWSLLSWVSMLLGRRAFHSFKATVPYQPSSLRCPSCVPPVPCFPVSFIPSH